MRTRPASHRKTMEPLFSNDARNGAGDDNCDNVDLAPAFTEQDEHLERASLSVTDITNLESDLRGITSGVANLNTDDGVSQQKPTSPHVIGSLQGLEDAVSRLPLSHTRAYRRASTEFSHLTTDEHKMTFVERESGNMGRGAIRLAKYWEARLIVFGKERCFEPMTLDGAMKEEANNLTARRIFQMMPNTDTAGRAIIFGTPSRRNFAEYSMDQEIMAVWYLMETCIENAQLRKNGVVFVADGRHMHRKQYSHKLKFLASLLDSVFPIRIRGLHFCYPSRVAYFVIYPVLKHLLGRENRLRFKLHRGSQEKVLNTLEGFCLPRNCLPTELGGLVTLDVNEWFEMRRKAETQGVPAGSIHRDGDANGSTSITKRRRAQNGSVSTRSASSTRSTSTSPLDVPVRSNAEVSPLKNDRLSAVQTVETKKRKKGRKSDPRMTRAVEAKLNNPDMPLHDALVYGGYAFDKDKIDADNITLRQRSNNLCRRIRQEKARRKEEGAMPTSEACEEEHQSQKRRRDNDNHYATDSSNRSSASPSLEAFPEQSLISSSVSPVLSGKSEQAGEPSAGAARRDSFSEKIMELPGLEDLDLLDFMDEDLGIDEKELGELDDMLRDR